MSSKGDWGLYDPRGPWITTPIRRPNLDLPTIATEISSGAQVGPITYPSVAINSDRPTYKKSLWLPISGTSDYWRPPTSYFRGVYHQIEGDQLIYHTGGLTYKGHPSTNEMYTALLPVIKYWQFASHQTSSFPMNGDIDNLVSRAETECLLKYKDQKLDLGTALAELLKTSNHLASTAGSLWGAIVSARRRDWRGVAKHLGVPHHRDKTITQGMATAKRWLEYKYAWLPLMGEAKGAYDLLREKLEPALLFSAIRNVRDTFPLNGVGRSGTYNGTQYTSTGEAQIHCQVKLYGRMDSLAARTASRAGLINPLAIAWEVVPFSFVIDWATPIGNVLQALNATKGTHFVGGYRLLRSNAIATVDVVRTRIYAGKPNTAGSCEVRKYLVDRKAYSDFPSPSLYAKSPFSSSHMIDALALLRQLV